MMYKCIWGDSDVMVKYQCRLFVRWLWLVKDGVRARADLHVYIHSPHGLLKNWSGVLLDENFLLAYDKYT